MLLIFVSASKFANASPYFRPSGRRILNARRSVRLIFPFPCTLSISSEYNNTASVFSSCAGSGTFTSACIHCGASPARAGPAAPSAQAASTTGAQPQQRTDLVARRCGHRLQDDLLFIGCPHDLVETAERRVEFLVETDQIAFHAAFDMQRPIIVFDFHRVLNNLGIGICWFWQAAHFPAERQFDR